MQVAFLFGGQSPGLGRTVSIFNVDVFPFWKDKKKERKKLLFDQGGVGLMLSLQSFLRKDVSLGCVGLS